MWLIFNGKKSIELIKIIKVAKAVKGGKIMSAWPWLLTCDHDQDHRRRSIVTHITTYKNKMKHLGSPSIKPLYMYKYLTLLAFYWNKLNPKLNKELSPWSMIWPQQGQFNPEIHIHQTLNKWYGLGQPSMPTKHIYRI